MDGHSTSDIGFNSASSTHSDNVGTQIPSSALSPKPKKSKQTSMVREHFTKVEGRVIMRILNHIASIVINCLVVPLEG